MGRLESFTVSMDLLSFHHHSTSTSDFQGYYHCHQSGEWLLIHQGCGQILIEDRAFELRRGMLFYFQPYQIHKIRAETSPDCPYIRSIIHFNPQAIETCLGSFPALQAFYRTLWLRKLEQQAFDLGDQMTYMEEMYARYKKRRHGLEASHRGETDGLFAIQLLILLRDLYENLPQRNAVQERPLRYAEEVMSWLETRYCEPFSLDNLARDLHLSKYYVSKVFREETGSSITQYIITRRMKEACLLLAGTGLSIEDIGLKLGLTNSSYFCQLFKKTFGMTPNRYRELQVT